MNTGRKITAAALILSLALTMGISSMAPQTAYADISGRTVLMDQENSQLLANAQAQRIVIPSGFIPSTPVYGAMYNNTGSVYYAVYMFRDPTYASSPDYRFGTFSFPNTNNSATSGYDGNVTLYGYYNGFGLFDHQGELFWANPMYFHSNTVSNIDATTQMVKQMAAAQGITLPDNFKAMDPIYGAMYNNTGTEYYAVLQYKDYATLGDKGKSTGTFCFQNTSNSATSKNDGNCTVYGYYMGYGLYAHYGTLFWAKPTYFHSEQITTAKSDEQLRETAAVQGITIPQNFSATYPCNGTMYNNSGSEYYAVYKFADPNNDSNDRILDSFWFPNSTNNSTTNCDSKVRLYGYANSYGLYEHYGELFWASPSFFHAN